MTSRVQQSFWSHLELSKIALSKSKSWEVEESLDSLCNQKYRGLSNGLSGSEVLRVFLDCELHNFFNYPL